MTIKKMSADMFDAIAENKEVKEEVLELTDEQAQTLYKAGIAELKNNILLFNIFESAINDSSFGFALLQTEEFLEFKEAMKYYMSFVIPALLEGDIDSIIEKAQKETEAENEKFRQDLELLRNLFYQELVERYL